MKPKKWAISALLATAAAGTPLATQQAPDVFDILSFKNIDHAKLSLFDVNHDGKFNAHDFIVPDSIAFIKRPEDLFDSKFVSENLDYPVFILDSKFSENIFGTKENPNEELRGLGKKSVSGRFPTDEELQTLVTVFKAALKNTFPGQDYLFDSMDMYTLYLQAGGSYSILMRAEGAPVDAAIGKARPIDDNNRKLSACFVTVTNPEAATWETLGTIPLRYAGQPISFPFDAEVIFHEIMAHEIGHCAQFRNRDNAIDSFFIPADIDQRKKNLAELLQSFEYQSATAHISEMDAKLIGQKTAQKMIGDPVKAEIYQKFSTALTQTTTFHIILQGIATGDQSTLFQISGYNYHLSAELFKKSGQIYDPYQLKQTRQSLVEKVLDPYQLYSPEKQETFAAYGFPTYRDVSARLKQLIAGQSLTKRERQMALSEINAFDTMGIIPADNQDHLKGWQKFQSNEKAAKATPAAPSF